MAKIALKQEAIRLRQDERLSLRAIQARLPVSKGALSLWLRSYPLTEAEVSARRRTSRKRVCVAQPPQNLRPLPDSTVARGHLAVLAVEARATEKGWVVSRPTTEAPYDLILDDGHTRYRAQVKYANGRSRSTGAVVVSLGRHEGGSKYRHKTYSRELVDVVMVFVPRIEKVLWIGPDVFESRRTISFRVTPPLNGQALRVNMAEVLQW